MIKFVHDLKRFFNPDGLFIQCLQNQTRLMAICYQQKELQFGSWKLKDFDFESRTEKHWWILKACDLRGRLAKERFQSICQRSHLSSQISSWSQVISATSISYQFSIIFLAPARLFTDLMDNLKFCSFLSSVSLSYCTIRSNNGRLKA